MDNSALVSINHLSKTYIEGGQERKILDNIKLDIKEGEFIVLLGRSGSGKSTLLNIISGIDEPSSGEVVINGVDITQLSEEKRTLFRRNNIGIVFQQFNLIPTLTVLENVMLPLELTGKIKKAQYQRVEQMLTSLGLAHRAKSFPDQLSGGEQQRVAILRALVHNPLIMLADEPTGSLDTETSKQVTALLSVITGNEKRTLILVTHNEDYINIADRVLLIEDGKIAAQVKKKAHPSPVPA